MGEDGGSRGRWGAAEPSGSVAVGRGPGGSEDDRADPFRTDDWVPETWDRGLKNELGAWKQGDLVERPGVTWLGPQQLDPVTGLSPGAFDWEPIAGPGFYSEWGIVRTQTCDLRADGPGRKHPFVEISPVVDMSFLDAGQRKQISRYEMTYLVALTNPPAEGFWVADLRVVTSISKAMLSRQVPVEAFSDETSRLHFAEAVARKYRRPAVHDVLSEDLPRLIESYIAEKDREGVAPEWHAAVEQVRITMTGDRLGPEKVSFLVVPDVDLSAAQRETWRAGLQRSSKALGKHNVTIGSIVFQNLDEMPARIYRNSVPLNIPSLGRPPTW
jgi:hypothetical protein